MLRETSKPAHNSGFKKLAAQWLNEALCFVSSSVLADSFEWVLKNYAKASRYIGLHFKNYDDFIFPPIIKKEILEADPIDKRYITVYLPSYCEQQLKDLLKPLKDTRFEVFCRETKQSHYFQNILFQPVDKNSFNKSLIYCTGIITGAGFETPAEALHLEKKVMCIPIKGQYEQQCNAAALKEMGVVCLNKISHDFKEQFIKWIGSTQQVQVNYNNSIYQCLSNLFEEQDNPVNKSVLATPSGLLSFYFDNLNKR